MSEYDFNYCKNAKHFSNSVYFNTISLGEFKEKFPKIKTLRIELFHVILGNLDEDYPSRDYPVVMTYQEITENSYPSDIRCLVGTGGHILLNRYLFIMQDEGKTQMDIKEKCLGKLIPESKLKNKKLNRNLYPNCYSEIIGRIILTYN